MKYISTLSIRLVLLLALFFVGVDNIKAESCGIINGQDFGSCAGGWYCVSGSCVQNSGCWVNVCQAPDTCQGDICMPASNTNDCPCGYKPDGVSCKSCSNFSCPTPVNCPADRLMFQSGTIYGDNWSARCPVGTAQSSVSSDTKKDPDTGESVCIGLRVTT